MRQFTIRTLLTLTALAAVEVFLLSYVAGPRMSEYMRTWKSEPVTVAWSVAGVLIGFCLLKPFNRQLLGAFLGGCLHVAISLYAMFTKRF
jgi:hypothetical protein